MPFIGQQPVTGAYHKLDSITASATATYNLQLNGGAYSPASANHLLVSLNGVIQAPQDSFTVSGSTITFASALTASDNIDFIMAFGDVLNIGTPSDGSVNTNQLANSAVTDAKIAGMASSKLTGALPAIDGSALTGISSAPNNEGSFSTRLGSTQTLSNQTWTKLQFVTTTFGFDTDSIYDNSTYSFDAPSTGVYFLGAGIRIANMNGTNDAVYIRPYVNNTQPTGAVGGEPLETVQYSWNATNTSMTPQTHGLMKLNAGDTVDMRVYTTAGTRDVYTNGSFFVGFRVS